jgi:hypothetical protein
VELRPGPLGEATAQRAEAAAGAGSCRWESGEVLENERRAAPCEVPDDRAGEGVEAGADPVPLPPTLPGEQPTLDPSVVGLLPSEEPSAGEVGRLDLAQLGEEDPNVPCAARLDEHAVEGRLVGVEGDQRGGSVGLGDLFGIEEDQTTGVQVELGDSVVGVGEDPTVVVGDGDGEGSPLGATQGEAEFAGLRIEVELGGEGPQERGPDVGQPGRSAAAESLAVGASDPEGDLGGGDPHRAEEVEVAGAVPREAGELGAGGEPSGERLAEAEVDEEAEVVESQADGRGEGLGGELRPPIRGRSRERPPRNGTRGQWEDESATGFHEKTGRAG